MTQFADLPSVIPIFPLSGAVVLPRARLPLHIFEPRYRAMVEDCMATPERLIGMVQPFGGRLAGIGCAGRLTGFSETEDGRYMITLSGLSRFRLRHEVEGDQLYRRAEVSWSDFKRDRGCCETDPQMDRSRLYSTLCRHLKAQGLGADWDAMKDAEDEVLVNALSMLLPWEPADKQALLEAASLCERRETLLTLMDYALMGCKDTKQ